MATDPTDVAALQAERSAVIGELAAYRALWMQQGSPLTGFDVNIDGESYPWGEFQAGKYKQIRDLTEIIRILSAPWIVRTR